jgi:AcrR family transcriptional regulator
VSLEIISALAGVARPQVYRHFEDRTDLRREVSRRISRMMLDDLASVLNPQGTPIETARVIISTFLRWLTTHPNLYHYITDRSDTADGNPRAAAGRRLAGFFAEYLTAYGVSTVAAEPGAFMIIGGVGAAAARWLDHPGELSIAELTEYLTEWVWLGIDMLLRRYGVVLDPDAPLPTAAEIAASRA